MTPLAESRGPERVPVVYACTDVGGRGCPCPWHAWRRAYNRRYAAKQRARVLDNRRMSATTCPRKFGRYGVCGGVLESDIVNGRLVVACPRCERFARGLCAECPRPVAGTPRKARFCAEHRRLADITNAANYRDRDRPAVNARARRAYRTSDAVRERRNEYKRQWRKVNRDKVRAHKRDYAARHPELIHSYQDEYRKAHRRKSRTRELKRYHGTLPLRTCITPRCSVVLTGRKKKCTKCKQREADNARALLAQRQGRGRRTDRRAA